MNKARTIADFEREIVRDIERRFELMRRICEIRQRPDPEMAELKRRIERLEADE